MTLSISAEAEKESFQEKPNALSLRISNASTLVEDSSAPHAMFEGKQFYDPDATWTPEEESQVKRKIDIRLLGWLCVMFFGEVVDSAACDTADAHEVHSWTVET